MTSSWIELDRAALRDNLRAARRALGRAVALFVVVKSDAYGHGLDPVARCAAAAGCTHFAVAHADEGIRLRGILPHAVILLLSAPTPDTVPDLLEHGLIPVIAGPEQGTALVAALRRHRLTRPLRCHVKIDTGMSRLGFDWTRAADQLGSLAAARKLDMQGVLSHFSDAGGEASHSPARQFQRFTTVIAACQRHGLTFPLRHISASGGFCENPAWDLDAVRLGILLYGYPPGPLRDRVGVRPVLQWKSRILQVKSLPRGRTVGYGDTRVLHRARRLAILDVGYADGYSRRLSNRGVVLIGGRRCPVIGRVSMNLTTVALPDGCPAVTGAEAVLIGRQGRATIWADALATLCETIPYEILTSIRRPDG